MAYQLAEKYPTLTAEIKESLAPENRYRDIVKRSKEAYKAQTLARLPFQQVKTNCLIANNIQKAVALRWETLAIPEQESQNTFKKWLGDLRKFSLKLKIPKTTYQFHQY